MGWIHLVQKRHDWRKAVEKKIILLLVIQRVSKIMTRFQIIISN